MRHGAIPAACLLCLSIAAQAGVTFPVPDGPINDFAGVLSAAEKDRLDQVAASLKQRNGAELAVAIVATVEPLDPKAYAVGLFEKWGIGQEGNDNGVLILLAMKERRIEIEVGYGLEAVLTDAVCGQLLDAHALPSFQQGRMGEGTVAVAQAVARVAAGESFEEVLPSFWTKGRLLRAFLVVGLSALLLWLLVWSLKRGIKLLPILPGGSLGALLGYSIPSLFGSPEMTIVLAVVFGTIGLTFGMMLDLFFGGSGRGVSSSRPSSASYGGGSNRSRSSSSSSRSSSSSSSSSSRSSSSGFGGGRSGGGGAGRSW